MSGFIKQKTVGINESNIAHLGGKEEHDARKNAAEGEKAFKAAGKVAGIEIWRIEALQVISWPKDKYGQFYSGDSYIVLKTNVDKEGKFSWDVHFWLGEHTSIDERGVAAYKTVELDDILGGVPVQYREVEGQESSKFLSYFTKPSIIVLAGGVESGFNKMKPEAYAPRLLWCKGTGKNIRVQQTAAVHASHLNHGDVFVLDAGLKLWQWNGKLSGAFERRKAADLTNALKADRAKAVLNVIDDGAEEDPEFWAAIGGTTADIKDAKAGGDDKAVVEFTKKIFRLSDSSGSMSFEEIASGRLSKDFLDSSDVFFIDIGIKLFCWVGSGASAGEKKEAMIRAENLIVSQGRPSSLPISRIIDGAGDEGEEFNDAFEK